jgi:hypothetical protein
MKSSLKELGLTFKVKESESEKKFILKLPYYLQEIKIETLLYKSGDSTTISLTGKSDDFFGKGIIKNFDLIMSKFNDLEIEQNLYTLENTNFGDKIGNLYQKFLGLNLYLKIFIISFFVVLFVNVFEVGKPSICDCNKVSMRELYKNGGSGKWSDCVKSYEKEIREFGRKNGQNYVNIYDEGHIYFSQNCNEDFNDF